MLCLWQAWQWQVREEIKKEVRYLEEKAKGASRKPQNAGK
jgi:hypothetical protein